MADYADLFCELFSDVAPGAFLAGGERWLASGDVHERAAEMESAVLSGALRSDAARARIADAPPDRRGEVAFGVLLGLDRALAHANPLLGAGPAPPAVAEYALRYAESGRFDSGRIAGALLPRFARPGRRGQLPQDLADAFGAVVRVGASEWDACDHAAMPGHARLSRADREGGLLVATAPMIREPDELRWEVEERSGVRFYRIHPADREPTRRRIEGIVAAWDREGAAIGLAPELCLSSRLLECWRSVLSEREPPAGSRLRLVVAGSGNVDGATPPSNTAVLLDARSGEILASQRKIHPFNLSEHDVDRWGLADRFPAPIDEDLSRGQRVCVIEAGGARLAILVCEDLARLHALAGALHAHGVSLILVPVFARPTQDRRWERAKAETYTDATGSTVVVANSLVIATILGHPAPVGTSIAVTPGHAAVGHAAEADDVVVFLLGAGEPRVAHERAPAS